jgi:TIR domain
MADIFISYAKPDRPLALKLAAMLEAEGWKTWWDTSLTIGDDFRNEIMTELGRARAVIVIWTDASVKSDWVRSEAGRAQADRKLIPVKLEHLTYKDLPPPFDVLHTENIGEDDKVRAAVVAQLAKPVVEPSAWGLLTKGFKYELLTWWGIIGGALTLFTAITATFQLARWAQVLVSSWKEWTHAFWLWAFGWLGIHVPPAWTPVLTFLSFGLLLAIGQAVKFKSTLKQQTSIDTYQEKSFHLISWRTFFSLVLTLVVAAGVSYIVPTIWALFLQDMPQGVWMITAISVLVVPQVAMVLLAKHKLYAALSAFFIVIFSAIITFAPLFSMGASSDTVFMLFVAIPLTWVLPLILLLIAPAKALSRRLIFLAIGLLLLIALNELSKLGLDVTAPKLQG